jgi:uroporphyrinogen-III decarboxylase
MTELTSRERMLKVISHEESDHIPCSFMSFTILRTRHHDNLFEAAKSELAMGLDPTLFIPTTPRTGRTDHPDLRGLPVRISPDVKVVEWREQNGDGSLYLHKEYITPAGRLSTGIKVSEDWPHGDHIPFIDDYQIPRALKPLVTKPEELDALQFLLIPPQKNDILQFQKHASEAHAFCKENGILMTGGWGVGLDMANWLCGMQNLMMLIFDQSAFVDQLLEMIHQWNVKRMEVLLSAPIDLYIRRSWYEGSDFITPKFYRQAILPRLKREVDLAHEHGVKFAYICSSGIMPFLDPYLEAGIDVLIGIDPIQGTKTDLTKIKEKLGNRICLWGGVSGAVTVEMGEEEEIRQAVTRAIQALGPHGFILSPVDNLTVDSVKTWKNIDILIDQWKKLCWPN